MRININSVYKTNHGFTATELLIAMALFSFVLTLSTHGFIQISQMYQHGLAVAQVQDATRYLQDDMTRTLRASDYIRIDSHEGNDVVCSDRHRFLMDDNVLYKQTISDDNNNPSRACVPSSGIQGLDSEQRITDDETVVLDFEVDGFNELGDGSGYYSAQITFKAGTAATLDPEEDEQCDPSDPAAHFCAVSEQTTVVTTRGAL